MMSLIQRLLLAPILLLTACAAANPADTVANLPAPQTRAVDLKNLPELAGILPALAEKRVVYVGETHDRYSHHLNQLAIVRGIHQRHPDLAIGLEFFQQPFQRHLDAYVAGEIDEQEMLRKTEYLNRWKYDYRLYRPILRYAREHGIDLVALNVPEELTRAVAQKGVEGLSPEQREQLPEIGEAGELYRERLSQVFKSHPQTESGDFERFVRSQLVWDEGMAERAAQYLRDHPGRRMVVLAGSGHLSYGIGIPARVSRRLEVDDAIVLNDPQEELDPNLADFVLITETLPLPPKGRLGIYMEDAEKGVRVADFTEESPAKQAGLEKGDRIVRLGGRTIDNTEDIVLVMLDRHPGETVEMSVMRERWLQADEQVEYRVTLQ